MARSDDLIGQTIGDYRILRRLGRGAMAVVYLAEQMSLSRRVALKVLLSNLAADASYVRRFRNEATAAAKLVHANIVQIHEVGEIEGVHFIAQEYVPGDNLGAVARKRGQLDPAMIVAILRQVAAALVKADEHGIVHRDIKPENLLLARSGEVKVADFGLARAAGDGVDLTQVGVTMGTPLYMSPEQVQGKPIDTRSDIYSLGATCYHLLVGRPPFEGDTALAVAVQHVNSTPKRVEDDCPDLPVGIARIIHKMLAKKPRDRYTSGRELLADLRSLAGLHATTIDGDAPWAAATDEWSTAELIALADQQSEATARLDQLMQTTAMLQPRHRWRRLAVAALLGLVLGGASARLFRPAFLLRDAEAAGIAPRKTTWAELYHAKLVDTEAAWKNVERFHPNNVYFHRLANIGLLHHYFFRNLNEQNLEKAIVVAQQLADTPAPDIKFQASGLAGLCIAYGQMNKPEKAANAFAQMTPRMIDVLRATDAMLHRRLMNVRLKLDKELRENSNEQFQLLQEAGPDN